MSEDLEAVAVTAGVNALAGLISQVPWSQIGARVKGVLSRRGRADDSELTQALESEGEADREQRLAAALARLSPEDRAAIADELGAPPHFSPIVVSGDKSPTHTGPGDQHITYH
ncbi:hypothetical protein [Streptomyces sp. NPDC004579]|uniref:hypothetical protein n=1 Tax=Streptomyces sp. NPDC004579 TaxID=3154667 RepID=UPI0033B8B230